MTRLDISSNNLTGGKWTNASGDNDRDDSSNYETNMAGVIALANAIPDMGAMTGLNVASNYLCGIDEYGEAVYDATGTVCSLSCLTCPSSYLLDCQCQGIIALADAIPDMGALSLLNLTDNNIGERVQKMKEMCVSRNISLLIN